MAAPGWRVDQLEARDLAVPLSVHRVVYFMGARALALFRVIPEAPVPFLPDLKLGTVQVQISKHC